MRRLLERIVRGEIDPGDGAYGVWSLTDALPQDDEWERRWVVFIGLASEYEDYPEGRLQLGAEIVAAAKERLVELDAATAYLPVAPVERGV